ncbi:MAG TPA: PEP/pyruvate-binding domain-containing protein [Gemmataceae bacterium]|nr:PEP/pyruvate-binding domain-containing protein [Gemmataceae bacterium]
MTELRTFDQITASDADAVGGKGLSLGLMASAGLPVPPGFCVTSEAYRRWRGQSLTDGHELGQRIADAYRVLGGGPVAVRSSATAEDGSAASFAGQQETYLGVQGDMEVCAAVCRCWASLQTERAVAYRKRQGVSDDGLAMAVVVQRLVPAEAAGVLFTRDPLDAEGRRMLVEASWGLGESVVSGRVTPDRFHIDRDTGAVLERHIHPKTIQTTAEGQQTVPPEKQNQPCLDDAQLALLAELGRQVEAFYGDARDVEWAWADGRFWLLQARPITAAGADEREQVRREEIAALTAKADANGTVWARFNLAESLPEPTPMTWAITRRFMSGRGGYGLMYRDLGFKPDASVDDDCSYDLIAGRPYCNLNRDLRFYAGWLPYEHSFARIKKDPQKAFYPMPRLNVARFGPRFWLTLPFRLPFLVAESVASGLKLSRTMRDFADRFRKEVLPAFAAEAAKGEAEDLASLDPPALLERLEQWTRRTLVDFARDSLKPTALAAIAMRAVEDKLRPHLGAGRVAAAVGALTTGVRPDPEADLPSAMNELAAGRLERVVFLQHFGWRGNREMELAEPRWSEDPAALDQMATTKGEPGASAPGDNREQAAAAEWQALIVEGKFAPEDLQALRPDVLSMQNYVGLRETAKHYLMRGYALIRRILVELDRRYRLGGGVFYLTPEELPQLIEGKDLADLIAKRRRRRTTALSLEAPPVLFSDDLEAIGRPVVIAGAEEMKGAPLSAGVAEGPALVLDQPRTDAIPADPYILVCPSTDPAWVPLFVRAKGLVMETGGVLSHGAIVAREFGLPAVAGLPDVVRRLRSGQRLRIDGGRGTVTVLAE